ncbi:MAG: isocitrate lyase/PEP mutase family protein [Ilumatobacteraceae bacterium]|nr:isocitrate lyase/PEP mutase family protein [Ilumatobacteraceae bacterium]
MSGTERSSNLRARLNAGESIVMPGVWDALSARLVHQAGFSTAFVSGFAVSGTLLGKPDVGYLTQVEMGAVAQRVCDAAPLLNAVVDADTGYGNPMNVRRTVEIWERSGAAGMFLEDQVWPKRCGHMAGKQVVSREDWLAKLRAACDHRQHLFVTARTDARAAVSLDEAIERARMARDTGVDALFIEAPESIAEMETIARALPDITLVANMVEKGMTPLLTPQELADLGFRLIVSPLSLLLAATKAIGDAAQVLATSGTMRENLENLVSFDSFTDIVGLPEHLATEQRDGS